MARRPPGHSCVCVEGCNAIYLRVSADPPRTFAYVCVGGCDAIHLSASAGHPRTFVYVCVEGCDAIHFSASAGHPRTFVYVCVEGCDAIHFSASASPPGPRSYVCVSMGAMQSKDQGPYLEHCYRCACSQDSGEVEKHSILKMQRYSGYWVPSSKVFRHPP